MIGKIGMIVGAVFIVIGLFLFTRAIYIRHAYESASTSEALIESERLAAIDKTHRDRDAVDWDRARQISQRIRQISQEISGIGLDISSDFALGKLTNPEKMEQLVQRMQQICREVSQLPPGIFDHDKSAQIARTTLQITTEMVENLSRGERDRNKMRYIERAVKQISREISKIAPEIDSQIASRLAAYHDKMGRLAPQIFGPTRPWEVSSKGDQPPETAPLWICGGIFVVGGAILIVLGNLATRTARIFGAGTPAKKA